MKTIPVYIACLSLFVPICSTVPAQEASRPAAIRLWPEGAPGAKGSSDEDIPSIQLYQPPADQATGAAIIVCPGGGYARLAPHEGHDIAVWLNSIGVTAAVLKYRLGPKYQHPAMMNDALRAIRLTRAKAAEWKIDPNRVGIMGFSAGGHLASTAATHFDAGDPNASDPIEKMSSRPDAAILCYPVITMTDPFAHKGSRRNLLGDNPSPQLIDLLSNEKQATDRTPPTFFFHTEDDAGVPVENSLLLAAALRRKKVPYELHVYERGRHGVGLAPNDPALGTWPKLLENWLRARGFVAQSPRISESAPANRRHAEIVRLINDLRVTPPEFAASSMILISTHEEVDDQWRVEILEEAFRIARDAHHPHKLKYLGKFHVDTPTGYKSMAFNLRMDRTSLQSLAVSHLIKPDPARARQLWGEMLKPALPALKCEETLVYDVSDYYRTLVELTQRAFTPDQMKRGEHIRFFDSHLPQIAFPAEAGEAALAIREIKTTPDQFDLLIKTYSRALEKIEPDDRSFSFYADRDVAVLFALTREGEKQNIPSAFLIESLREYLVSQLNAPRCADNLVAGGKPVGTPKFVTLFNDSLGIYKHIPKIADSQIRPRKIAGEARFHSYWETPRAKSLLEGIKVLRFGPPEKQTASARANRPITPLPSEVRRSVEWQYKLSERLREFSRWKPEHEKSADDYFHQKCNLFNALIELSPDNSMRHRTIGEYMAYLEQNRFERESFIEWFLHVSDLLRRVRIMEKGEQAAILNALEDSNDHVLRLCVKLRKLLKPAKIEMLEPTQ